MLEERTIRELPHAHRRPAEQTVVEGSRRCARCLRLKPLDQFYRRNNRPCGRYSWCKTCNRVHVAGLRAECPKRQAAIRAYETSPERKAAKREHDRERNARPDIKAANAKQRRERYATDALYRLKTQRASTASRLRKATTPERRASAQALLDAYDREIARLESAPKRRSA
jgi:hypothetical protein